MELERWVRLNRNCYNLINQEIKRSVLLLIIPKELEGVNSSERYILNKLKSLYLQELGIEFLYLAPEIGNLNPDFILIDPKRGVLILEIKAWSIDFISSVNDKFITTSKGEELENPLFKAKRYFNTLQNLLKKRKNLIDSRGKLKFTLHSKIIFTELLREDIRPFKERFEQYPADAIYKEELKSLSFDKLFGQSKRELDQKTIDEIRGVIFPEIKLKLDKPKEITTLDYEQERFARSLPIGHYMITGVPGSGKSVTLISRAFYLARSYPKWRILIVVYNRLLMSNMKKSISLLVKETSIKNIEVKTFHQVAMSLISRDKNIEFNSLDDSFWRDELPQIALKYANPKYDAILIDEYQDFYKSWFVLLLKLLRPFKKDKRDYFNIFLAGDRLQSIYHPKEINWKKDIGLDMRGRSKFLRVSYRVKNEHLNLALNILMSDREYKREVEEFYEGLNGVKFQNSKRDSISLLEGDYSLVVKQILKLLDSYKKEEILVLSLKRYTLNRVKKMLPKNISKDIIISKEFNSQKMLFSTLHSSKGIETKVVILVDIDNIEDRKLFYVGATRASNRLILHSFDFEAGEISKEIYQLMKNS